MKRQEVEHVIKHSHSQPHKFKSHDSNFGAFFDSVSFIKSRDFNESFEMEVKEKNN